MLRRYNEEDDHKSMSPKILGVTLARGGSKGVPRKNLVEVGGKPLLKHTFDIVPALCLTRYIVSTDDEEIAEYSRSCGVDVPFIRPSELARDTSSSTEALQHAVSFCENEQGFKYDVILELMATNPFKTALHAKHCIEKLLTTNADSVITVARVEEFHPARLKMIVNDKLVDFYPEESGRRQDLTPYAYIRNGGIYALNRDMLMNQNHRFGGGNSRPLIVDDVPNINIDSYCDVLLADSFLNGLCDI